MGPKSVNSASPLVLVVNRLCFEYQSLRVLDRRENGEFSSLINYLLICNERKEYRREHENFVHYSVTLSWATCPYICSRIQPKQMSNTVFCLYFFESKVGLREEWCRNIPSQQCWLYKRDDLHGRGDI